jgi:predicted metal-dependent hydrolase
MNQELELMPQIPSEPLQHWVPDHPHAAHFMDAMHLIFPAAERAFCRALRQSSSFIDDVELKAHIKDFVRQEAHHATAHSRAYANLAEHGRWTLRAQRLAERAVGAMFGRARARTRMGLAWQVASVAAAEHLTAELGRWAFEDSRFEESNCDRRVVELIKWHCAEEVDHRSVAFDACHALTPCSARALRTAAMTVWIPVLLVVWFLCGQALVLDDPRVTRKAMLLRRLKRAARSGVMPGFPGLFRAMVPFYRAAYHPSTAFSQVAVANAAAYAASHSAPAY